MMPKLDKMPKLETALKDFANYIQGNISIISDPMNRCPEDFVEEFSRQELKEIQKLWLLGATDEQISLAYQCAYQCEGEKLE